MKLQLEDAVMEYAKQARRQDDFLSAFYLDIVRKQAKTVIRNYGLVWDQRAEDLLKDCCIRYDLFSGLTFLSFFSECVEHEYNVSMIQTWESYYSVEGYNGTDKRTFKRTWTSNPERLTMERVPERRKGKDISK